MVYVVFSRSLSSTNPTNVTLPGPSDADCRAANIRCFSDGIFGTPQDSSQFGSSIATAAGPTLATSASLREVWLVMGAGGYENARNAANQISSSGRVALLALHPNFEWTPGLNDANWSGWNTNLQQLYVSDALWFGQKLQLIGDIDQSTTNGSADKAPELLINSAYALWTKQTDQTTQTSSSELGQVSYLFYGGRGSM